MVPVTARLTASLKAPRSQLPHQCRFLRSQGQLWESNIPRTSCPRAAGHDPWWLREAELPHNLETLSPCRWECARVCSTCTQGHHASSEPYGHSAEASVARDALRLVDAEPWTNHWNARLSCHRRHGRFRTNLRLPSGCLVQKPHHQKPRDSTQPRTLPLKERLMELHYLLPQEWRCPASAPLSLARLLRQDSQQGFCRSGRVPRSRVSS
mmetsp:Transcript_12159/g.22744  ORF Transcript_12159/g.22744 Transcript_12159/m.22744 type:complete len:210 (+) Transcript_12159:192-821(+)